MLDNLKWAAGQADQAAKHFERASERYAADAKRAAETTQEAVELAVKQHQAMAKRVTETVTKTVGLWREALQPDAE